MVLVDHFAFLCGLPGRLVSQTCAVVPMATKGLGDIGLSDAEHFVGETAQVLFIRLRYEPGDALLVSCCVEHLAPADQRLVSLDGERDGHEEVTAFRQML